MILKEKQLTNSQDPKIRAGEDAEKQMAFYIKRAFGKSKDCYVLNDVYISHDGENAQIDHLIITQFGLFIIESKSVHGTISINKLNEWSRTYNNKPEGMRSPVTRAEEQGKIIKECIRANTEKLRSKLFGLQQGFRYCPIIVYIAISDTGIIDRKTTIPELFKADQICKAIEKKLKELDKLASLLSFSLEGGWTMRYEEAKKVAEFLINQHQPKKAEAKPVVSTIELVSDKVVIPKAGAICPKCNMHKLIRKSVPRSNGTDTEFLACAGYPDECKGIYPLVTLAKIAELSEVIITDIENKELKENDPCPNCKNGKTVKKKGIKGKPDFFACSLYSKTKCKFQKSIS